MEILPQVLSCYHLYDILLYFQGDDISVFVIPLHNFKTSK